MKLRHLYFDIVSDFDIRISSSCRTFSTIVENVLQISLFLTNKPNFPHFPPKNADCAEKQTQFKPNQSQFWANFKGEQSQTKPIQTQFQKVCLPFIQTVALTTIHCGQNFEKTLKFENKLFLTKRWIIWYR